MCFAFRGSTSKVESYYDIIYVRYDIADLTLLIQKLNLDLQLFSVFEI